LFGNESLAQKTLLNNYTYFLDFVNGLLDQTDGSPGWS